MTQLNLTSFASLLPNAAAADPTGQFNVCQDRDYQDMNVAVDPFCNPKHYMKANTDPDVVLDYMESHDYVDKDTETGLPKDAENEYGQYVKNCMDRSVAIGGYTEDNDNKGTECIMGSASKTPSTDPGCNSGSADDNTECKRNMFRLMYEDASVDDGMENGYASGGGTNTGNQSSSAAPAECTSMATDDLGQIACKAYQFDPYGYKWGGGHGGTAKGFMTDFKAGKYTANQDAILDCSGLVRMAIYDATGTDIGGMGTESYLNYSKFKEVNKADAKAGDILYKPGHTEIIVSNNIGQKRYVTFGAHTANTVFGKQIGPSSYSYDGVSKVFRFQK